MTPDLDEGVGQLRVGGEMEIGEQDEAGPEMAVLLFLGLFDLEDELGPPGVIHRDHLGSRRDVVAVVDGRSRPGPRLDQDRCPWTQQFPGPVGGQRHPVLPGLDLRRDADDHTTRRYRRPGEMGAACGRYRWDATAQKG